MGGANPCTVPPTHTVSQKISRRFQDELTGGPAGPLSPSLPSLPGEPGGPGRRSSDGAPGGPGCPGGPRGPGGPYSQKIRDGKQDVELVGGREGVAGEDPAAAHSP